MAYAIPRGHGIALGRRLDGLKGVAGPVTVVKRLLR
jgi:hypothetical protein